MADQIDLAGFSHVVKNFREEQVDAVVCLESQLDAYKETLTWYDSIYRVFGCIGAIDRVYMEKPIHVGSSVAS